MKIRKKGHIKNEEHKVFDCINCNGSFEIGKEEYDHFTYLNNGMGVKCPTKFCFKYFTWEDGSREAYTRFVEFPDKESVTSD